LASICREFAIQEPERESTHLEQLSDYLLSEHDAGRTVVLVIDEAQNLTPDVLEQLRMISNLETEQSKLIQIILAGQPELNDILNRHDLRQLNQRVTVRCQLTAMDYRDTGEYISHRLKVSGCRIPQLFSRGAVRKIYRFSHGIPRLINIICEQALVLAWTRESPLVTSTIAGHVIRDAGPGAGHRGMLLRLLAWLIPGVR
jgi:general secretion pathway protein A